MKTNDFPAVQEAERAATAQMEFYKAMMQVPERWYVVDRDGLTTLCSDEANARHVESELNRLYPQYAPHRAVRLGEVGASVARNMRWIPVTERLPEENTEVLICFAGQMSIPATGQYTGNPRDKHGWSYPAENYGMCEDGSDPVVTHWMPTPEVPAVCQEKA